MSCKNCLNYSALQMPRPVDANNYIYGYCYRDNANMGKGYPIYIPEGSCNSPKLCKEAKPEGLDPKFKCELCKKEMRKKIERIIS